MAGLKVEGFYPESLSVIRDRIENRLREINTGFDFSPESPDGQLIGIVSAELALLWQELENVYRSYDPNTATGQSLRNIAQLTGLTLETATRSYATVTAGGISGTIIPAGSLVASVDGYVFYTNQDYEIEGGTVDMVVIASNLGEVPVEAGSIAVIDSVVEGWDTIAQLSDGTQGQPPQDEQIFRNLRNRTVMRNTLTVEESITAGLEQLGIHQAFVYNNDTDSIGADLITPARHIHVTVGDTEVSDAEIAERVYKLKGLGVLTHGNITASIQDTLGYSHDVSFTRAAELPIHINLSITYLSDEIGGAGEAIRSAVLSHINSLGVGEDIIWSRLFGLITPHGKAQINSLEISTDGVSYASSNVSIPETLYPRASAVNFNLTVV